MDARQYMIIDLEKKGDKRMFVTERVDSIKEKENGLWSVRFTGNPRMFQYNPARLLCLTHPESINLGERGLYIKNRHITNVSEVLRFSDDTHSYYHITYNNGYYDNLEGRDVYITRTAIDRRNRSLWSYLNKLADETSLLTEDEDSILSKQYERVDTHRDNVPLSQYMGDNAPLKTYKTPKHIYYPFGCNASQKSAVEAALTHQVSIIQGPPGTGKTQTILNIIANLLMAGKSVLVVSNNNSAVENVAEKLAGEQLDFIVAKLGSAENKEQFIAHQTGYPEMNGWMLREPSQVNALATSSLHAVSQGFDSQTRQAQLKAEYDALLKETIYNNLMLEEKPNLKWLSGKPSRKILSVLNRYKMMAEKGKMPTLLFRLKWAFHLERHMLYFLKDKPSEIIAQLETAYYHTRKHELESELSRIDSSLKGLNIEKEVKTLRSSSLDLLKHHIAKHYSQAERKRFSIRDLRYRSDEFLHEYPVVLSTTYSAKSCISNDMVFDYVIMDEASQVDIKTGALALSCATNAIIVGDDKQLPNVISQEEEQALNAILSVYQVEEKYNALTHSFLQSCTEVFEDAPVTLLREHYRCHPKIIEFCNQRFYDGELVTMTADKDEKKVLQVVRTVKGNHARGHFNQREIDVIAQEVMPEYANLGSIGIITPYRSQAQAINQALHQDIASTVHKFQGRECDTIIMSMVDNAPTEFSDDPNLLNVAISRAKKHLCIVTNGNEMEPDSNLAQLIAYMLYNNFKIKESRLHSVFDLLYSSYTTERLAYSAQHTSVSEHLSENLIYDLLVQAISDLKLTNTAVLCHYPLSRLIADWSLLDNSERTFAKSPFAHVDFLIYNTLTKRPRLAIEVDGWHFHQDNEVQQSRDTLKDQLLTKFDLCPHRISTTDTVTLETIKKLLG